MIGNPYLDKNGRTPKGVGRPPQEAQSENPNSAGRDGGDPGWSLGRDLRERHRRWNAAE